MRRGPPPAMREFRAAWIATVNHIDWPSRRGMTTAEQKKELIGLLDEAKRLRLNGLVFQIRPACDALYRSRLEPWSEWLTGVEGQPPSPMWDPLQFAIEAARSRGLELHAWFNPFRARHLAAKSASAETHVSRKSGLTVRYGQELWLDPGLPAARDHTLAVILDVVDRYDIDGVHIDDYFYPYPVQGRDFPDESSYTRYRNSGGKLARADWRRQNVDSLVAEIHRLIRRRKPWVKFGISPFGIARPGLPVGIKAGLDQYSQLYADVRKWLREGWCDYMSPQLYWPIDQREQSYARLLDWWVGQNPHRRHLWIGNFSSKVEGPTAKWPKEEILDQIRLTRRERGATGNVHFSMKALRRGTVLGKALRNGPYFDPALIPASPWLDDKPPLPPELTLQRNTEGGLEMRWPRDPDVRWRAVYLLCANRWRHVEVLPAATPGMRLTQQNLEDLRISAVAVSAVDRCGNESERVIRPVE